MKYSVIIPAYNAKKTIRRCLDSVIDQIRDDIEVIVVNDGSTDQTGAICTGYADQYPNVKYVSKQNEGVSIARNTGIQNASGEYILFVDSDDYVCDKLFENLDQLLEECNYDLIMLSHISKQTENEKKHKCSDFIGMKKENTLRKVAEMISTKQINSPWSKLYKASIIKEHAVDFTPHVSIAEDRSFNIKYSMYIDTIRISGYFGYIVTLDNENSLSRGVRNNLQEQFDLATADYEKEFNRCNLSEKQKRIIKNGLNFCEYRAVYSEAKRMHIAGKSKTVRRRFIKNKCREINKKHLSFSISKYNLIIVIPVKLMLIDLIDFVAYKLAND